MFSVNESGRAGELLFFSLVLCFFGKVLTLVFVLIFIISCCNVCFEKTFVFIEMATDATVLATENWGLNMEICDFINNTTEGYFLSPFYFSRILVRRAKSEMFFFKVLQEIE